ncbi:MAG: pseudouridine synthase [Mycobacteriales bacterium]
MQRVLAMAGLGSRRHCEELIAAGRVEVDGQRVSVQGMRVDPGRAVIRVDGERLATASHLVHLALHKPAGVLSAMSDDRGRPTVGDIVADRTERLFHVGRLDADTEGLLLLMNDGELAHRLSHPSYEVAKTYLAEVAGPVARDVGRRLRRGVDLEDGTVAVDSFKLVGSAGSRVMVELIVHEGRKHVVRRLLETVGHPVSRLVRTSVGPVQLGTLKAGRVRHLTRHEVGALYGLVGL